MESSSQFAPWQSNFWLKKIRQTEQISGIIVGKKQYKLCLFADDLLLFLSNVYSSIQYVTKIKTEFSRLSSNKMKVGRTELMVIDKSRINMENLKQLKLQTKNFKYRLLH